jgi:hypothetical protein
MREEYGLPPVGSEEDAQFQLKVKALIRQNEELRYQLRDLESARRDENAALRQLAAVREENIRLQHEAALRAAYPPAVSYPALPTAPPLSYAPFAPAPLPAQTCGGCVPPPAYVPPQQPAYAPPAPQPNAWQGVPCSGDAGLCPYRRA